MYSSTKYFLHIHFVSQFTTHISNTKNIPPSLMNQNLLRCQAVRLYSAELWDDSYIGREVEGAGRSLFEGAVPALTWRR
jgi:hypothetical protein